MESPLIPAIKTLSDDAGLTLDCRTLRLVPAVPEHVDILHKDQLYGENNEDNVRLFKETYRKPCSSKQDLAKVLFDYRVIRPHSITWTILDKDDSRPIGWVLFRSAVSDSTTVEAAFFLQREIRPEVITECNYYICPSLFDQLGFSRLEFRSGILRNTIGPGGGKLGMSFLGIISRQMKDWSRCGDSDLWVLKKETWPAMREAIRAWLDATHGEESKFETGFAVDRAEPTGWFYTEGLRW